MNSGLSRIIIIIIAININTSNPPMKPLFIFTFIFSLQLLPYSQSDPSDVTCLTQFYASISDPNNLVSKNWTKLNLANPCNTSFDSPLTGATCNNGRIYRLALSDLKLSGTISPFISNCSNLQSLDLSSNLLSGPIPTSLKDLTNLAVLNLSSNSLSGPIPPLLSLCAYLNVIDLHKNQLSGPIPQQLGLLVRLNTFDVSNNRLSGMIPPSLGNRSGNFLPKFNASSFIGNKDLYGYPLEPYDGKGKGLSVMAIVGIGLGSGLLSLILSFTIVCVWLRITEHKMVAEESKITQFMPEY